MKLTSNRSGYIFHVQSDYDCYVPSSLFDYKIQYDEELIVLLIDANSSIGKLNGISEYLPNKDVFLSMYVQKESVVSSQIEGTQASLSDVLKKSKDVKLDIEEIVNYVKALNKGIELLDSLPISIRLFKKLHKILLNGVRGDNKNPGEIRKSQNWIGPKTSSLKNASFVPPSLDKMKECLYDLENYINSDIHIDNLIKIALIHYQFETIHPFLDGNGRLGRLLIPLFLIETNILKSPLLYLSLYFKENRNEYYNLLTNVRFKGEYEKWIKFFLKGIIEMANNSIDTIKKLHKLNIDIESKIESLNVKNKTYLKNTLKYIYSNPYFKSSDLVCDLNITKPTANSIINTFIDLHIISSIDSKQRNSTYRFNDYIDILEEGTNI